MHCDLLIRCFCTHFFFEVEFPALFPGVRAFSKMHFRDWKSRATHHTSGRISCRLRSSASSPTHGATRCTWGDLSTRLHVPPGRCSSASRRHLFGAHDHGRPRSDRFSGCPSPLSPIRRPDCTLSRLPASAAKEHDRAGDPVDSDPDATFRVNPGSPPHLRTDGLLHGELPPITPEF